MNRPSLLLGAAFLPALLVSPARAEEAPQYGADPNAIIVTALPLGLRGDETAQPVVTLAGEELVHQRQATLGETLSGQPGINSDNFGGGASRPVIRGQTAPRVEVLSDGLKLEDASAISPDHAVTTEPLLLRGVEVLRGPATLLYGGGAIGGAVNLLDDKVPTRLPAGGVSGVAEARIGTADHERALTGGLTAAAGPFAFRLEGAVRRSDDYQVPDGFPGGEVEGSYNDTSTLSAGASWIGASGFIGVAYTRQRSEYGLPGHEHEYEECHPHGATLHCEAHDGGDGEGGEEHDHDHEEEGGVHPVPVIKLRSERFDIRSDFENPLDGIERVRFRLAFTDYAHDEIEEGVVGTTFLNKATDMRLEVAHAPIAGLRGVVGVQYGTSDFSALGDEAFLLDNETRNAALFLMESAQVGPVRLELAARQEWQRIRPEGGLFQTLRYRPFSLSGAAVWKLAEGYSLSLSLARSQRAPNAQELFAYGVHLATNTFEIGNAFSRFLAGQAPDLGKETARSVDLTFRKTSGATTFTLGAFHQDFDNYIYAATLDRFEDFRLVEYRGADARFTGVDGEIRQQLGGNLAVSLFGDYVRGRLKDGLGNLPRIPAGRLGGSVEGRLGVLSGEIEYSRVFDQKRIAAFETRTGGYDMLNATLSVGVDVGKTKAELFVRGTNLTNALAFNHSSFIKDASPLRGRSVVFGLRGSF